MLEPSARNFYRGNLERVEVIDPSEGFRGQGCCLRYSACLLGRLSPTDNPRGTKEKQLCRLGRRGSLIKGLSHYFPSPLNK